MTREPHAQHLWSAVTGCRGQKSCIHNGLLHPAGRECVLGTQRGVGTLSMQISLAFIVIAFKYV